MDRDNTQLLTITYCLTLKKGFDMHSINLVITDLPLHVELEPFDEDFLTEFEDCTDEAMAMWERLSDEEKNRCDNKLYNYAIDYLGYEKRGDKYGLLYNPDALWDWYDVGGRWDGCLKNKFGDSCSCTKLNNLDVDSLEQTFEYVIVDGEIETSCTTLDRTKEVIRDVLKELPIDNDYMVYAVDFHI